MKSHEVMKSYEVKVFHSRRNWIVDSMQKPERECCWKCWLSPGLAISLTHFQDTGLQEMLVLEDQTENVALVHAFIFI